MAIIILLGNFHLCFPHLGENYSPKPGENKLAPLDLFVFFGVHVTNT